MKLIRLLKWDLASEAQIWVDQGYIQETQAQKILSTYGTKLPDESTKTFGYYALLALSVLMVGMAVIVFLSHNWENIPRFLRMGLLVASVIITHIVGHRYLHKGHELASNLWFLFSAMLYGASIFLIAQIYHINEYYPNGILFWAAGVVPLALLRRSFPIALLGSFVSSLWVITEASHAHVPYMYIPFALAGFWYCFKIRQSLIIYCITLVTSIYVGEVFISSLVQDYWYRLNFGAENVYFTFSVFIFLFLISHFIMKRSKSCMSLDYAAFTHMWTVRFGVLSLCILSFKEMWRDLIHGSADITAVVLLAPIPVITSFILLNKKMLGRLINQGKIKGEECSQLFFAVGFTLLCWIIPITDRTYALEFQIMTNLVILCTGIYMIRTGIQRHLGSYFFLGVSVIVLLAFLRYVDLIGDYIGGTAVFLVGAGITYMSSRFWVSHRGIPRVKELRT